MNMSDISTHLSILFILVFGMILFSCNGNGTIEVKKGDTTVVTPLEQNIEDEQSEVKNGNTNFVTHLPTHLTVIFFDKSGSVDYSKTTERLSKAKKGIEDNLKLNFKNNGDKIYIYYIHSSTAGGSLVKDYQLKIKRCDTIKDETERDECETFNIRLLRDKRKKINTELTNNLLEKNPHNTQNETDIYASLERLSEVFVKDKAVSKTVLYLSDMIHSTKEVDLEYRLVKDREKCEKMAQEHWEVFIKKYKIKVSLFKNVHISAIVPDENLNPLKKKEFLKYYWEEVFEKKLGAKFTME